NLPLVCDGHGHKLQRYARSGTSYAMGASVSNRGSPARSYRVFQVEPQQITSIIRNIEKDTTTTEDPVPTDSMKRSNLVASADAESGLFQVTLDDQPFSGEAAVILDQQTSQGLTIEAGRLDISGANLSNGIHQLTVEVPDNGTTVISTV